MPGPRVLPGLGLGARHHALVRGVKRFEGLLGSFGAPPRGKIRPDDSLYEFHVAEHILMLHVVKNRNTNQHQTQKN